VESGSFRVRAGQRRQLSEGEDANDQGSASEDEEEEEEEESDSDSQSLQEKQGPHRAMVIFVQLRIAPQNPKTPIIEIGYLYKMKLSCID